MDFEQDYRRLVETTWRNGELRQGRNGETYSLFGSQLSFDLQAEFPLISGRRIYYKGVLGELAAFVRGPKNLRDFEAHGCNYWAQWADDEAGNIAIDYGNAWIDWDGVNQLEALIQGLRKDPHGRRHMLSSWNPSNVLRDTLSLPCCHHTYQFYVTNAGTLDMHWMQRSTDIMVGLPSDAVLAAAMTIALANETGLTPGRVQMSLGDAHIYDVHKEGVAEYLSRTTPTNSQPSTAYAGTLTSFVAQAFLINNYEPLEPIRFEVVA